MQPFIGITVGEIVNAKETWAPPSYGQRRLFIDAVVAAGGVPLILPLIGDETILRALYELCSGLLLSGGNDVDPSLYGAQPDEHTKDISPRRDAQELLLLKWALSDHVPVLGICRGMQLMNVALGGSLHQDIASKLPGSVNHTATVDKEDFTYLAHKLKLDPKSKLAGILGAEDIKTNALHHQSVNKLSDQLIATAWAEDGIIEAVELPGKRFVIGVQSHPEALIIAEPRWHELFQSFVESSKK